MEHDISQPDDSSRLAALLEEAGLKSFRMDENRRSLLFRGRTREWTIVARMRSGWLNLYTWVCELPAESGVRGRTLETALSLNKEMTLTKFIAAEALILELDYREEHVDADILHDLVGLLHANAEEAYPKIYRRITGDDVLAALERCESKRS